MSHSEPRIVFEELVSDCDDEEGIRVRVWSDGDIEVLNQHNENWIASSENTRKLAHVMLNAALISDRLLGRISFYNE